MWTTPTAEAPPALNPRPARGLNLRLVLHAIWRHPLALCGVLVFAATVGAGIWLFLPLPKKTAAVMFYISPQPTNLLTSTVESRTDFGTYRQSQVSLVKLRTTLNKALDDPRVRGLPILREATPDPLTWLENNVSVDSKGGVEYMRITVEGDQDRELLALVAAVGKAYEAATRDRDNDARATRQAELQKEYDKIKQELKEYDKKIWSLAKDLGGTDDVWLALVVAAREEALRKAVLELPTFQGKLELAKGRLEAAQKASQERERRPATTAVTGAVWLATLAQPAVDIPAELVELVLARDTGLQVREAAVTRAREDLRRYADPDRPDPPAPLVAAKDALKTAEQERDRYRAEARAAIVAREEGVQREKLAQQESTQIAKAQREKDEAQFEVAQVQARIERIRTEMENHNKSKRELDDVKRDIKQKELLAAQMDLDIQKLRVELKAPQRVKAWDDPFIVTGLGGNRRMTVALAATVATFFLGFAGVVFWEFRSRRATHADELSTDLGTRLIGTIPPLAPAGPTPNAAHSDLIEAIDTTRIMLTHGSPLGDDVRVLVVTSAVSGEGKTTLSGNLAISLTRAGFKTLLIDGDTRAPTAHTLFNLAETPGLGELLREEADAAAAVRSSPIPGLSVLPAGNWTPATHQMLAGSRWRQLKRELKEEFDFVVIDTSPLLLVSDTMLLAREADGVVLSVLLGVSQISRVAETVARLNAVGAKLAGVVVNNVRSSAAQHADAYRAKYYARSTAALLPHTGLVEQTASPTENG